MDILQAIRHALDGNAVLFLGSGFSYGAKNSLNATLPQATELANLMLIEIKYKTTGNTSLTQASKSYEKHKGKNSLIEFLHRQLLAVETQKYHRTISKTPWYQIYTTNFDDVFEFAQSEVIDSLQKELNRPKLESSIKEKLKARLDVLKRDSVTTDLEGHNCPQHAIIHLNGYLKAQDVFREVNAFRLTGESYLSNELPEIWREKFRMSLRAAKAVIFIGFSGSGDYIIMKDLNSVTGLKEKAFFITKPDEDPTLVDTLEDYGTVCQIGVNGIADKIDEQLKEYIPSLIKTQFISFEESKLFTVNPTKTFIENQYINALHTTGQFDPRLLILGSDEDYKLLLMRYQVKSIVNSIKTKKEICLYIIHAFLGNGKTIALKMIEHQLLLDNISVYKLTNETDITLREVEEMCASNQKMVILFENFYAHEKLIKMFTSQPSGSIALVSTARTPVYESKIASLEDMMKRYIFCEYDINSFSRNNGEIEKLIDIFDANALWGRRHPHGNFEKEDLIKSCKYQFKNLILETMNSEDILSRYKKVIKQIREKMPYYRLSLFCILKSLLSIDLSMDETLSLFPNEISYGMKFRQDIYVKEFIDFGNSSYKLDSATVATKMLEMDATLFDNAVDVLAEVIERADKSKDINNNYRQMLNTLVSFRLLRSSLNEIKIESLLLYYDKIRNTNYCKENPMFWLQYALAFISAKRIDDAQRCIDSAYGWVKKTHNYDTYQVDTVQAECWLEDLLIHTTEVPTKATLDKWEEATEYILVPQNVHSKDDIAKRFKLVDRYYGVLFNSIFMVAEQDMQMRIITLLNSTKSNILQYHSVLSNSKAISVDSLLEKLDNCLNKVPDTFFSLV